MRELAGHDTPSLLTWRGDIVIPEGAVRQRHLLHVDAHIWRQVRWRVQCPGIICVASRAGATEHIHPAYKQMTSVSFLYACTVLMELLYQLRFMSSSIQTPSLKTIFPHRQLQCGGRVVPGHKYLQPASDETQQQHH